MNDAKVLIKRITADNEVLIPNGVDFTKASGFYLSLPDAASVHYQTWGGQVYTKTLPQGVYLVRMKKVFADNATVVYAVF